MTEKLPTGPLKCILLVDDDEPTNFHNKLVIEDLGVKAHIQVAESAFEALEYLAGKGQYWQEVPDNPQPGIIFLDINMPGLDGWDFLDELKNLPLPQKSEMVIAILTTSSNPDDEKKARTLNVIEDFLKKPLTKEMVNSLVNKYWPGTI